jgi:HTH-type transcriptional regulator/antitoxin HipB
VGADFDLCGALRRIRRLADLSQRQLAAAAALSPSAVAHAEAGTRDLPVSALARVAATAGLRLSLVDCDGHEIAGMSAETVRDMIGRRFPAHLDTRYSDDAWLHGPYRSDRQHPWYTFDRDRRARDGQRAREGPAADHQLPQYGDSPQARAAARRLEYLRAEAEERERAFLAGEFCGIDVAFECTCPPLCDELDDRSGKPVHAEACPCGCDLG